MTRPHEAGLPPGTPDDPLAALRKRARILNRLLDDRGRVSRWPARRAQQLIVLDHIAAQIEDGRVMSERELGAHLEEMHAFHDSARIRRELVDLGVLQRYRDGSAYWKAGDGPPDENAPR
ncbi:MAG: DUF2087 domain-containing protein [Dehalococcoidia bacterium]